MENEQIVQAANEEALRAMEQLEQMAPPVEEKPAFDFQAKRLRQIKIGYKLKLLR